MIRLFEPLRWKHSIAGELEAHIEEKAADLMDSGVPEIPFLTGRSFSERDSASSARVAVVNQELVRHYFAGQNPIGQRFGYGDSPDEIEIVGVVAGAKYNDLRQESIPWRIFPGGRSCPRGSMP